jgi:hypothetical protein
LRENHRVIHSAITLLFSYHLVIPPVQPAIALTCTRRLRGPSTP